MLPISDHPRIFYSYYKCIEESRYINLLPVNEFIVTNPMYMKLYIFSFKYIDTLTYQIDEKLASLKIKHGLMKRQ